MSRWLIPALAVAVALAAAGGQAQEPAAADVKALIGNLGSLDYATRTRAARLLRRAAEPTVVPALADAARQHQDQFVRYRALVLLTSFGPRAVGDLGRTFLGDRNDRVRQVAYQWLEGHPDARLTPALLASLQTEAAEFVRPALVGALAALGSDPAVQRALVAETSRGLDIFRSAVIDALGRHRAVYAVDAIAAVARPEGPLQDDAVLALGRIGGPRGQAALQALGEVPPDLMLSVRAARCLAGGDCAAEIAALVSAANAVSASPARRRTAVSALAAVAGQGNDAASAALLGLGAAGGALREDAAIGLGAAALRSPNETIGWLAAMPPDTQTTAIALLKDGFDSLEDDYAEEQFFASARASYWRAAEGSPGRALPATLIERLEF